MVHAITSFIVECVGVITDLQILLLTIDRRGVSIMSTLFTNRRVTNLRFIDVFELIWNNGEKIGQRKDCFDKTPEEFGISKKCKGISVNVCSLNEVFIE